MNWEIFGLLAGTITITGFIPQIIKGYKTKRLDDLSYFLNVLMGIGMFMWMIYGIHIRSLSIVAANIVGLLFNIALIFMKYFYSKRKIKT